MKDFWMFIYCLFLIFLVAMAGLFALFIVAALLLGPFLLAIFVHPAYSAIYVVYLITAWIRGYKKKKQ